MKEFKFFSSEKINQLYPEGILNGYYNHNMPYEDLRPYHKSCCGVDIFSEVNATTYKDLMVLDNWVNVQILGVLIDGVVYCSEHINQVWEFPENWEEDKKYIYEFIIVTYPMLDDSNIEEDSWEEVSREIMLYSEEVELPQREETGGVFLNTKDRLTILEDVINYNL